MNTTYEPHPRYANKWTNEITCLARAVFAAHYASGRPCSSAEFAGHFERMFPDAWDKLQELYGSTPRFSAHHRLAQVLGEIAKPVGWKPPRRPQQSKPRRTWGASP